MKTLIAFILALLCLPLQVSAQSENDYYRIVSFPLPEDVVLEVGGLDWLDKEKTRLLACTRRGELWVIDNPYADPPTLPGQKVSIKNEQGQTVEVDPTPEQIVSYKKMLFGLHEPLGLLVNPGKGFPDGIYMAQRGELTRVADENGDDRIDVVETFCDQWEICGSYHEYAFGPRIGKDGGMWITLNRPFGGGQEPEAYWRGWAISIDKDGNIHPICPGLRSPCGVGTNADGEMFYTDNQGDHVAVCKLSHLKPGSFQGNPVGLASVKHPLSNFKLPFENYPSLGMTWQKAVEANPLLQAPAIWFPYANMGRSHSDIIWDNTEGKFGPFSKQLFIGDQGNAIIVRVFMEKVNGEYQGACFPFRSNFQSGVLRMCWGNDGSMFVGGTNRGWGGGSRPYCLERLEWTGETPFEIQEMQARPNGFRLVFTKEVNRETAANVQSYQMRSWTYNYYGNYGDDPKNTQSLPIQQAIVHDDGRTVDLVIEGLRTYHVHELKAPGIRSADNLPVLHPEAYYTLNQIPK